MDVFRLQQNLVADYSAYTRSFIKIKEDRIKSFVSEKLDEGKYWPEPLVQLNPMFQSGGTVRELVDAGLLHEGCDAVFRVDKEEALPGKPIVFHQHQRDAIALYAEGKSYVLTSGTGSGKSLAYIVPIVDHVLKQGTGKGIQAIVVYPMNALANSQYEELDKFINAGFPEGEAPVRFARYTGQESEDDRREIRDNPPDVLLTNYMMLELLLTRKQDMPIVRHAKRLSFLVFDEIHTYRGRQGADVAMLIRRCKESFQAPDVLCIGTSATMASGGNAKEQKEVVARVASKFFGINIQPDEVIGETLTRRTAEHDFEALDTWKALHVELSSASPPKDVVDFIHSPLAGWIEDFFGLERSPDSSALRRRKPRSIHGSSGAVADLLDAFRRLDLPELPKETIGQALIAYFKQGSELKPEGDRFPVFAFKLHQFFSRGDTVWSTLTADPSRHLDISKTVSDPKNPQHLLYPLVFCKSCGCEYYRVSKITRDDGSVRFLPREDRMDVEVDGEAGFLYLSAKEPWPMSGSAEELDRLPDEFKREGGQLNPDRRKWVPERHTVGLDGVAQPDGAVAAYVQQNFRFCLDPSCKVTYPAHTRSERAKLLTLGVDTRSTATTILALRTLQELRDKKADLPPKARKLLSFTDNRQDASLQAGHFNDFTQVALLRSALYRVLTANPEGVKSSSLPRLLFEVMNLPFEDYASNPDVRGPAREPAQETLKKVIEYLLFRDLMEGWRVTTPNMEQCGLVRFDYDYLVSRTDSLVHDEEIWSQGFTDNGHFRAVPELLQGIDKEAREELLRTLLDHFRRNLCIKAPRLSPDHQQELIREVNSYISEDTAWYLESDKDLEQGRILYPNSRPKNRADRNGIYVSALGAYGRFLKREFLKRQGAGAAIRTQDLEGVLEHLIRALTAYGLIEKVREYEDQHGYQLISDRILWQPGDGTPPANPLKVIEGSQEEQEGNAYFRELYRVFLDFDGGFEAREHTAQVDSAEREQREQQFKTARLPLLFCSPTMELGVDIAQLNVVNLRNVPPTPANYAQRSGRAGRGGQPAFVFTYCAGRSPHDQYYFNHPQQMVAGEVAAPRIDLTNKELLQSHVNAVWLEMSGLGLGKVIPDLLVVVPKQDDEHGYILKDDVRFALEDQSARERATERANRIISGLASEFEEASALDQHWVEERIRSIEVQFHLALKRWRELYEAADSMRLINNRIVTDMSRPERDRNVAKAMRAQAEMQIELLTLAKGTFEGDFYTYRYFAAEGFLPGYNFPRLPISAFVPGRTKRSGRDEFISRPRFLAISEFGPRAMIYHNGKRYVVQRVNMDLEQGEEGLVFQELKRCAQCGHGHLVDPQNPVEVCTLCGTSLSPETVISRLVQMQNVSLRLKERITCDEEERQRYGYKVTNTVSFAHVEQRDAELLVDDQVVCKLHFGPTATLWRINRGWSNAKKDEPEGFVLDLESGRWQNNAMEEDAESAYGSKTARIVPYVEDRKNALLLRPIGLKDDLMPSLQSALKEAMHQVFQVEPMELAVEGLPDRFDRRSLLFFEISEGGAGVLKELVKDGMAWKRVIRKALELCHFDPDTGNDLAPDVCSKACYRCLLDYANQPDHMHLDRYRLKDTLLEWRKLTLRSAGGVGTRHQRFEALHARCDSQLERKWLDMVYKAGLKLPSHSQENMRNLYAKPDFEYREEMAVIFIDGPVHDQQSTKVLDDDRTNQILDAGYRILRFHHAEDWPSLFRANPDIFGTYKP